LKGCSAHTAATATAAFYVDTNAYITTAITLNSVASSRCRRNHFLLLLLRNDLCRVMFQTPCKWWQPSSQAASPVANATHSTATRSATTGRVGLIRDHPLAQCVRARSRPVKLNCLWRCVAFMRGCVQTFVHLHTQHTHTCAHTLLRYLSLCALYC
jgi:hypothetical protein